MRKLASTDRLPDASCSQAPTQQSADPGATTNIVRPRVDEVRLFPGAANTQPSQEQLISFSGTLAALNAKFNECGVPEGYFALLRLLSTMPDLQRAATTPTQEYRNAAVALFQKWTEQVVDAIAPARDGADLNCLYGFDPQLDRAIDAMRHSAVTQMLLQYEARRRDLAGMRTSPLPIRMFDADAMGEVDTERRVATDKHEISRIVAGKASFLPSMNGPLVPTGSLRGLTGLLGGINADAKAVVDMERRIATDKREVSRILAGTASFMPSMDDLQVTPELLQGLNQTAPEILRAVGPMLVKLQADETALANSWPGKRLRDAILEILSTEAPSGKHRAYLERRAAALQPRSPQDGLTGANIDSLQIRGVAQEDLPALLHDLAVRGMVSIDSIEQGIDGMEQAIDRLTLAAKQCPVSPLEVQRGRALATKLLIHVTGMPDQAGLPANEQIRAALSGTGLLDSIGTPSTSAASATRDLPALAGQYETLVRAQEAARGDQVSAMLDTLTTRVVSETGRPLEDITFNAGPVADAAQQKQMNAILSRRCDAMGAAAATTLRQVLRAAALLTRPEDPARIQSRTPWDTLKGVFNRVTHVWQPAESREQHRADLEALLRTWGMDPQACAPEIHDLLSRPIDGERLAHWIGDAELSAGLASTKELGLSAPSTLAEESGGTPPVSLAHLTQQIDQLEVGSTVRLDLYGGRSVSTGPAWPTIGVVAHARATATRSAFHGVHVSRDSSGYALALSRERGAAGSLNLELKVATIGSIASLYAIPKATFGMNGGNGLVMRFPDSEEGLTSLKGLVHRMVNHGLLQPSDLSDTQELFTARTQGHSVHASVDVGIASAVPALYKSLISGSSLSLGPTFKAGAGASAEWTETTIQNGRQTIQERKRSFTVELSVESEPSLAVSVSTGARSLHLHVQDERVPHAKARLAEVGVVEEIRKVIESDHMSGETQRSIRFEGPGWLTAAAVRQLGGTQLGSVMSQIQTARDPAAQELQRALAALLDPAPHGSEIRLVWRVTPKVRQAVDTLLGEARNLSIGHPGIRATPEDLAEAKRLRARAEALLNDGANYHPHAMERLNIATSIISDESDWAFFKRDDRVSGRWEQVASRLEFDPKLLKAALGMQAD
ncbi:hypothetical protein [Ralstonia sp. A12]|uniref:hypothetical protein n=1 Tax=Ralstonia sp. A12 TaxID=1217052 RepID=UPI0012ECF69A|nr:hypothetical protein [Ralstonia sp. A12]